MQPERIDTTKAGTESIKNKNLDVETDDNGLSITPEWLKSNVLNEYEDYRSQHYNQARPPSPNSPRWASEDDRQESTPSSLPSTTVLGSSPNWIRDNTLSNASKDEVDYNIYNDQDEEILMQKFKALKIMNQSRIDDKKADAGQGSLEELNSVATPQLYSVEIDDAVTLSENHLFRQCLHPNRKSYHVQISSHY